MTSNRSRIDLRALLVAMTLPLAACESTAMTHATPPPPTPVPYTLVELVRALPAPMPTTVEKVQALLGTPLRVQEENPYGVFYESGPFITRDNHVIATVDARLAKPGSDHWRAGGVQVFLLALTFDVSGCVPMKPLHDAIGLGSPTSVSEPAPWGETHYARNTTWGSIGLAVSNARPDCVKSLGVSTDKSTADLPQ